MDIINKIHNAGIVNRIDTKSKQDKPVDSTNSFNSRDILEADKLEAQAVNFDQEIQSLQTRISENQARENVLEDIISQFKELASIIPENHSGKGFKEEIGKMIDKIGKYVETAEFNGKKLVIPGKEFAALLSDGIISKNRVTNIVEELETQISDSREEIATDSQSLEKRAVALENSLAAYSGIGDYEKSMKIAKLTAEQVKNGNFGETTNLFQIDSDRIKAFLTDL